MTLPPVEPARLAALRDAARRLPAAPGVYLFLGEDARLPVYIGKSVNLRQRVLSHLRNPQEARLQRLSRAIEHIPTAGEIGALLLEAQLIKRRQPLLNQRLRRTRHLCALRLVEGRPQVVDTRSVDFAREPGLYGLYASRHAALEALQALADTHRLCGLALGLEAPGLAGRPCFRAQVQRCAGLCAGRESAEAHDARLRDALAGLQLTCWPFEGAVGLVEGHGPERQVHVVRNWCYLGSVHDPREAARLDRVAAGFDADGYRILCGPLLAGALDVVAL